MLRPSSNSRLVTASNNFIASFSGEKSTGAKYEQVVHSSRSFLRSWTAVSQTKIASSEGRNRDLDGGFVIRPFNAKREQLAAEKDRAGSVHHPAMTSQRRIMQTQRKPAGFEQDRRGSVRVETGSRGVGCPDSPKRLRAEAGERRPSESGRARLVKAVQSVCLLLAAKKFQNKGMSRADDLSEFLQQTMQHTNVPGKAQGKDSLLEDFLSEQRRIQVRADAQKEFSSSPASQLSKLKFELEAVVACPAKISPQEASFLRQVAPRYPALRQARLPRLPRLPAPNRTDGPPTQPQPRVLQLRA